MTEQSLQRTPLFDVHMSLGARMVPFGGWEMPVQYESIIDEHRAVRSTAGLFDVSHMGEFFFEGPGARDLVQYLTSNDVDVLSVGRAQYSMFLHESGGTVDDLLVYLLDTDKYLIVVNAGNIEKDWSHVIDVAADFDNVDVHNRSDDYALLALQGPEAETILSEFTDADVAGLRYYHIMPATVADCEVRVSRTGYTGEDGFEIMAPSDVAVPLWNALLGAVDDAGGLPAGLGARDTLRLEASLPLYGHELDDETTPLEAGLGYFVAKGGDYLGSTVIKRQREEGLDKKLVCLEMRGRGIPREDYPVQTPDCEEVGYVTSGSYAPWLDKNIAMAYVPPALAEVGNTVNVVIRNRKVAAEIVKRPFYSR